MSNGAVGVARDETVDVFRGLTVAAMLLVNNPGTWSSIYDPLEHAAWHGWTPTDLIFPFFLFVVGVTTHFSLSARRQHGATDRRLLQQVVRRGLLIILIGVLLNWFPFYTWGRIEGIDDPTLWQRIVRRFEHLRVTGVLQRIGLVYLVTGIVALRSRNRRILPLAIVVALLLGYWVVMTLVAVPDHRVRGSDVLDQPEKTIAAWSDRVIIGKNHLWRRGAWDPEGPLSTLPAIATALLGFIAARTFFAHGQWEKKRLAIVGIVLVTFGLLWGLVFPINKNLWTSSYVVFTAGAAMLGLACCSALSGKTLFRPVQAFAIPFGVNPLIAFVGSGVMARLVDSLIKVNDDGKPTSLHLVIYKTMFAPFFVPEFASLLYAIAFVMFWWLLLLVLHRRGIYWKV